MRSETSSNHQCPSCHGEGRSVAPMNYAETQDWEKDIRGGLFRKYEEGKSQTRRAKMFDKPRHIPKPVVGLILFGIYLSLIYIGYTVIFVNSAPHYAVVSSAHTTANVYGEAANNLGGIIDMFLPILVLGFIGIFSFAALTNKTDNDKRSTEIYPRLLKRYEALYYCEPCHLLYDQQSRQAPANESGFRSLMEVDGLTMDDDGGEVAS